MFQQSPSQSKGIYVPPADPDRRAKVEWDSESGQAYVIAEPDDYLSGTLYPRWGLRSKLKLCDMAGAPWSDSNPKASVRKHKAQVRFLRRRERVKVLQGGSRLGKSVLGGIDLLIGFLTPNSKVAILASMYEQVDAEWSYFGKGLKRLFKDNWGVLTHYVHVNKPTDHRFGADAIWGSWARGFSTATGDGDVLMGKGFTHLVLGEGSKIPIEIFDTKMWRGLNNALMNFEHTHRESGFLSVYTTADEMNGVSSTLWDRALSATNHDIRQLHYGKVNFAESMYFREASVAENPDYDKSALESARKILSKEAFDEQMLGKRGLRVGRVYSEYKPALHKVSAATFDWKRLRDMRLFLGFDTGTHFAGVLVGLDRAGNFWVLGEAITTKVHTEESGRKTKEMLVRTVGRAFEIETYEQIRPGIHGWKVDPASETKIELRKALGLGEDGVGISLTLPQRPGGGKFLLNPTIDILKGLFLSNKIYILDNLPSLLDEIGKYQWDKKNRGHGLTVETKPVEANDHALDAMRFALVPLMMAGPLPPEEKSPLALTRLGLGFDPHATLHKWQRRAASRPVAC